MRMLRTTNNTPLALDLMLKCLVDSAQFNALETKNWESLCRLVPGTTAQQVSKHPSR